MITHNTFTDNGTLYIEVFVDGEIYQVAANDNPDAFVGVFADAKTGEPVVVFAK